MFYYFHLFRILPPFLAKCGGATFFHTPRGADITNKACTRSQQGPGVTRHRRGIRCKRHYDGRVQKKKKNPDRWRADTRQNGRKSTQTDPERFETTRRSNDDGCSKLECVLCRCICKERWVSFWRVPPSTSYERGAVRNNKIRASIVTRRVKNRKKIAVFGHFFVFSTRSITDWNYYECGLAKYQQITINMPNTKVNTYFIHKLKIVFTISVKRKIKF